MLHTLLPLSALAGLAASHGMLASPETRTPGAATAAACGQAMADFYLEDPTSYPEAFMRTPDWDADVGPSCNLYLCKGYQFDDNTENVLEYTTGEEVDMEVFIRIPHVGYANVSVVDTERNEVLEELKVWEDGYADGDVFPDLPLDQTNFTVTVPELGGKCAEPGACVSRIFLLPLSSI